MWQRAEDCGGVVVVVGARGAGRERPRTKVVGSCPRPEVRMVYGHKSKVKRRLSSPCVCVCFITLRL